MTTSAPPSLDSTCFAALDVESRTLLTQRSSRLAFRSDRPVLRTGEPVSHVLCLLKGTVRVSLRLNEGTGPLLGLLAPPSLVGLGEVLTLEKLHFNIYTIEPSDLLAVPADLFRGWAQRQPRFAFALNLELAGRIDTQKSQLGRLAYGNIAERLGRLLLDYAELCGTSTPDGIRIRARLSQQSLAEDLGVDRKSILRSMERFRELGLLNKTQGRYVLRSEDALREFANVPRPGLELPGAEVTPLTVSAPRLIPS